MARRALSTFPIRSLGDPLRRLAVWGAVWLAVGEALYRAAGWDRTLSGLIGIAVASAVAGLAERAARRGRFRRPRTSPPPKPGLEQDATREGRREGMESKCRDRGPCTNA